MQQPTNNSPTATVDMLADLAVANSKKDGWSIRKGLDDHINEYAADPTPKNWADVVWLRAAAEKAGEADLPDVPEAPEGGDEALNARVNQLTHRLTTYDSLLNPTKSAAAVAPKKTPAAHHRYISDDDEFEKYAPIGVDGLLAATEKALAVNRGIADPDDRDSLPNDRIYTVDKLFAERVKLDHGKTLRTLMGRLSRQRSLNALGPAAFDEYTTGYFRGNPLAPALEEINPMHIREQQTRITKMGPGGIGDRNAITTDMQAVDGRQFGFIDPLAGPESEMAGIDVRVATGARVGSDGKIYQKMRNKRTGQMEWVSPTDLLGKTLKLPD